MPVYAPSGEPRLAELFPAKKTDALSGEPDHDAPQPCLRRLTRCLRCCYRMFAADRTASWWYVLSYRRRWQLRLPLRL